MTSKETGDFLPKRFKEYSKKLPISAEVMQLEFELERLLNKPEDQLTKHEKQLIEYLFDRCSRLWKKTSTRTLVYKIKEIAANP